MHQQSSLSVEAAALEAAMEDGVLSSSNSNINNSSKNTRNVQVSSNTSNIPARGKITLRRGKWTTEEEDYSNKLIHEFKLGLLPLTDGTTLRTFLAKLLNCDPMRISKKFVGQNCIGKQVFRRRQSDIERLTLEQMENTRNELLELERKFLERVAQTNRSKSTISTKGVPGYDDNGMVVPWMMPPDDNFVDSPRTNYDTIKLLSSAAESYNAKVVPPVPTFDNSNSSSSSSSTTYNSSNIRSNAGSSNNNSSGSTAFNSGNSHNAVSSTITANNNNDMNNYNTVNRTQLQGQAQQQQYNAYRQGVDGGSSQIRIKEEVLPRNLKPFETSTAAAASFTSSDIKQFAVWPTNESSYTAASVNVPTSASLSVGRSQASECVNEFNSSNSYLASMNDDSHINLNTNQSMHDNRAINSNSTDMTRNSSVDNFWLLVDMGDIPRPDNNVLVEPLFLSNGEKCVDTGSVPTSAALSSSSGGSHSHGNYAHSGTSYGNNSITYGSNSTAYGNSKLVDKFNNAYYEAVELRQKQMHEYNQAHLLLQQNHQQQQQQQQFLYQHQQIPSSPPNTSNQTDNNIIKRKHTQIDSPPDVSGDKLPKL